MTESEERWAPFPGWEGLYEVSSLGNVRSVDRVVTNSRGSEVSYLGRPVQVQPDGMVGLSKGNRTVRKSARLARWKAFGKPQGGIDSEREERT